MKSLIIIFIFTVFILQTSNSQVAQQWVRTYNGTGNISDYANDVATDAARNVYCTGIARNSNNDIVTIKYNSSGVQQWAAVYNGPGNGVDIGNSIAVSPSGNVYVTGQTTIAGNANYVTIKYNSSGTQQWAVFYDGPDNDYDAAYFIALDANENVIVTGESTGNETDITVIKYNSSGIQQWSTTYNNIINNRHEAVYDMALDNSGNVFITGQSQVNGNDWNIITVKYSASGQEEWAAGYSGTYNGNDRAQSITIDNNGIAYICGTVQTGPGLARDCFTMKYNQVGLYQWARFYNGSANLDDEGYKIVVDASFNVYVGGYANITGQNSNYLLIKYNSSGTEQWISSYNGPGNHIDRVQSMAIDTSGIYLTGYSNADTNINYDFATIKYRAANGSQLWEIRHNGPANSYDAPTSMILDNSGGILISGSSTGSTVDFTTIKYVQTPAVPVLSLPPNGSSGIPLTPFFSWQPVLNAVTYRLQVSSDSNFTTTLINDSTVTGSGYSTGSGVLQNNVRYYWRLNAKNAAGTSMFSTVWSFTTGMVGIDPISTEIPEEFMMYNNYPNPYNPLTKIKFDIPEPSLTKITIYDISGREVKTLVNENLNAGKYEINIDASGLSSGVYLYRMNAGDFTQVKKMMLVK